MAEEGVHNRGGCRRHVAAIARDKATRIERVDRRVVTVGLLRDLAQLPWIGKPAWREAFADEKDRLAPFAHRSEPHGERLQRIANHRVPNRLRRAHLVDVLLFGGVAWRVFATPSLEALDRLQGRIVIVSERDISDRRQGIHHRDEIAGAELADEGRQRLTNEMRSLGADLIVGQKDRKNPNIVAAGLEFFGVAIECLSCNRSGPGAVRRCGWS